MKKPQKLSAPPSGLWSQVSRRPILSLITLAVLALGGLELTRAFQGTVEAQTDSGRKAQDKGTPERPTGQPDGPAPTTEKVPAKLPVILLTGFEPFGEGRSPNPSWEGIKSLDGKTWRGYRLVAKQARVVWGAPMEQLQEWIAQHQPVAVFSFGQGGSGAFAIESKAHNSRGRIPDNNGEQPASAWIVEGGTRQFEATIRADALARALTEKGYHTVVSTNAGRYLCEEMLYTLEHLKSQKKVPGAVMFCHVPPLGARLRGKQVTAEYVQEFVNDLLESWHTLELKATSQASAQRSDLGDTKDPRYGEVKELIERYFRTWSDQDMKGYDECFLPDATISHIDPRGRLSSSSRAQFVASQREYHRTFPVRTVEVPETIDIRFEQKLARAVVYWKLTAGAQTDNGYDHFTLMHTDGKWRIINLIYYATTR